jgi:hypothetical protein
MQAIFDFIVIPKEQEKSELILNTELQNHLFVNRIGVVQNVPKNNKTPIKKGDEIIVHHNVFRRFRDIKGKEKFSKSYYKDNLYFVAPEQIYGYKRVVKWQALEGFNFVQPIKETKMFSNDIEKPLTGILKYKDPKLQNVEENDLIGFTPNSEYEFVVNNMKLYRVPTNSITIKYEYEGNEEAYNPSWAQSS